ncbi:hypothetical protein WA158_002659 [Blastocystis sp. Blastoise]
MKLLYSELGPIFIFLIMCVVLSYLAFAFSYYLGKKAEDSNKLIAYECGFNPFDDARDTFDVHFYLVAILFLMFDLEVTFLFPWALSLNVISYTGFWSMMIFIFILTLGFIFEWKKGALEWE